SAGEHHARLLGSQDHTLPLGRVVHGQILLRQGFVTDALPVEGHAHGGSAAFAKLLHCSAATRHGKDVSPAIRIHDRCAIARYLGLYNPWGLFTKVSSLPVASV